MNITPITNIEGKKKIAILDTSAVSFLQHINEKCSSAEVILKDYDLILIPRWVVKEISDSKISASYVEGLMEKGYPIFSIAEEDYTSLVNYEEWNLYQIVKASVNLLGQIKGYLRRYIEKTDPLDMDAYAEWINKLYDEWPIEGSIISSGRHKKEDAGEVSIAILAEILAWYYTESEMITIYSHDSDTRAFQTSAEDQLRKVFTSRVPIPVSYKSNDAILCHLFRLGILSEEDIRSERKANRRITYSKVMNDKSVAFATELLDTNDFINLVKDNSVHIVF